MKIRIVFLFSILFCVLNADGASIQLLEAIKTKKVFTKTTGTASGHNGKSILLDLKNISSNSLELEIPLGLIFEPKDSFLQNMMVTEPLFVKLYPSEQKKIELYAMCIQKNQGSPLSDDTFQPKGLASKELIKVANLVDELNVQDHLGQSALWVVSDKQSITTIWDERIEEANQLRTLTASITNQPLVLLTKENLMSNKVEPFIPERIKMWYPEFSIHVAEGRDIQVVLNTESGELVKELFQGKSSKEKMLLKYSLSSRDLPRGRYKVLLFIDKKQRSQIMIDKNF